MQKLYVFYIGGKVEGSNLELHDMRFVVSDSIENCYPQLRKEWWGTPDSLHIDCHAMLEWADGFDIEIKDTPPPVSDHKLYFINLGGYDLNQFTELHENLFVVANSESAAKIKALKKVNWQAAHKDAQIDLDNAVCLSQSQKGLYLHLSPSVAEKEFEFSCKYVPIGKEAT